MLRLHTAAARSALDVYLSTVGDTSPLTADEERHLTRRIRAGDSHARDRMVTANLRLVIFIARRYACTVAVLLDLIGEGTLGRNCPVK